MDRDEVLKPYALAIGYLTIEWNGLHSTLAMLFSALMTDSYFGPAHYVWDSTPSDRSQREMLRAIIKSNHTRDEDRRLSKERVEAIEWLLKEADSLAEQRNNALHAIYTPVAKKGVTNVEFLPFSKRTRQMAVKAEPLAALAFYRHKAHLLSKFAAQLAMRPGEVPERPRLTK